MAHGRRQNCMPLSTASLQPGTRKYTVYSVASRAKTSLPRGITRLVFMMAFTVLPSGNVVEGQGFGASGGIDAREASSQNMDAEYYEPLSSATISFNLLSPEEAEYWAAKLPVFPIAASMAVATRATWRTLPTTYAYGKKDNSILFLVEQRMMYRAKEQVDISNLSEEYLKTDHSPHDIIGVLERAWTTYAKTAATL